MGRRKSGRAMVVQIFLRLRERENEDLIASFERIPCGRRR
jgi:hypothetical protein